ncbi:MAG: MFS transporter [Ahrensia sp.]|nr:MFS transporter [Ahrensia sp.]|tara:strand:+ start:2502 stop:3749 length:1248 start_codon:yes stop_codon:yes gene_type:complete
MLRLVLPVSGLLTSTLFLLSGLGLIGVLLPVRAAVEGWSPVVIGLIGFAYALCFTAGCIGVPRLVLRVGHIRVYAVLATLLAMSTLMHALFVNPVAWVIFRGIAGFALAGSYMIVESWLNEKTGNEDRGTVYSIYMIVTSIGVMGGQFLLVVADPATATLFMVAALLYAAAVIPTGLSNASSPQPLSQVRLNFRKLYANSPLAFIGIAVNGVIFGAYNFQMPVYLQLSGFPNAQIATAMAAAMIGGTVFQMPLGRVSDKMDRRRVITAVSVAGAALSIALASISEASFALQIALIVLFGGTLMPLYSLIAAHANDHAASDEFVEISSGLLIIYGVGTMIGPLVAGGFMSVLGPAGFFVMLAGFYIVFAAYAIWRITQRAAVPQDETTDYTFTATVVPSPTPETLQLDPRSDETAT